MSILPSGVGRVIQAATPKSYGFEPREVSRLAHEYGFLVIRGLDFSLDEFTDAMNRAGDLMRHTDGRGNGYDAILVYDHEARPDARVTGMGSLPLHQDGLLWRQEISYTTLYCARTSRPGSASGAPVVVDAVAALAEMPEAMRRVLEEHGLEGRTDDSNWYPTTGSDWIKLPTLVESPRGPSLRILMPFEQGAPTSWYVRVPDLRESDEFLAELDRYLMREEFAYSHRWQPGDLLVVDNRSVLHGRGAIEPGTGMLKYRAQFRPAG
jgi:(5R)-carbapenem-3-carboxylate synthase